MSQRSDASSTSRQRRRSTAQVRCKTTQTDSTQQKQCAQCRRQTNRLQTRRAVRHGTAQPFKGTAGEFRHYWAASRVGRSTCNMLHTRGMLALWRCSAANPVKAHSLRAEVWKAMQAWINGADGTHHRACASSTAHFAGAADSLSVYIACSASQRMGGHACIRVHAVTTTT